MLRSSKYKSSEARNEVLLICMTFHDSQRNMLNRLRCLIFTRLSLGPRGCSLFLLWLLCLAQCSRLIVTENSMLMMSVIYWIFAIFQWVAKYLYELVYFSLNITHWGSTIIFLVCRLADWDSECLNELPKSSHLMYGLGVGWWDKFSQTPGLVFLMSLATEFFDYVEWPDILYLGEKKC